MAKAEGFHLYDCKVRLQGSVLNEVPKTGVTAPEIAVYQQLHGADAVVSVKPTGKMVKRTDRAERERLNNIFASPAGWVGEALDKKVRMLRDLFGHESNALPKTFAQPAEPSDDDDFSIPGEEQEEIVAVDAEEPAPAAPIVRTKVTRAPQPGGGTGGVQPSFAD